MKNEYKIVEKNTVIELIDEELKPYYMSFPNDVVIIYANGYHYRKWPVIIDAHNLDKVDKAIDGAWYVKVSKGTVYAFFCKETKGKREYTSLHRLITDCPSGMVVDHHPHHFGLDNRECNLTVKTASENNQNRYSAYTKKLLYNK